MDRDEFVELVDKGWYCDQDVIDLYDEIQSLRENKRTFLRGLRTGIRKMTRR